MLLAVAEHGGVAAAARALTFTPPAVSQQLAALERQLGTSLVDRSGRTAVLTPTGLRLAEHAQAVLAGLEAAEAEIVSLARPDGAVVDELTVAAVPTLGRTLVPEVVRRCAAETQLTLRIEQLEPEESLPAVARGEVDIALAGEYSLAPRRLPTALHRQDLFTEPVHVVVPVDHRATGDSVRLADLQDERWISPAVGSSCAVLLERSCAIAGFEPHVVAHCADFDMAMALTAAGHGISMVPELALQHDDEVRVLRVLDPPVHRTLYAAVRHGTDRRPGISALLRMLDDLADERTSAARRPS